MPTLRYSTVSAAVAAFANRQTFQAVSDNISLIVPTLKACSPFHRHEDHLALLLLSCRASFDVARCDQILRGIAVLAHGVGYLEIA